MRSTKQNSSYSEFRFVIEGYCSKNSRKEVFEISERNAVQTHKQVNLNKDVYRVSAGSFTSIIFIRNFKELMEYFLN